MAIALDRISQAFSVRTIKEPYNGNYIQRHPWISTSFAVIVGTLILGIFIPSVQAYPKEFTITTGPFWSDAMEYINVNFFDAFEAIKVFVLQSLLVPVKKFYVKLFSDSITVFLSILWGIS